MRDLQNNVNVLQVTNPAVQTNNVTSSTVDLQGYNSCTVLFALGQAGDTLSGTVLWTLKLQESADDVTYTDVLAADMIGAQTVVVDAPTKDKQTYKLSYNGSKRYLKGLAVKTGTHTVGTPIGVVALRGEAARAPVS